ncbi:MAG: hypothetical protein HFE84_04310, partial [Lachnospiraceae bacterium]|nr:hypothetical protein [Lachnospiraceae bacterium]
ARMREYLYVLKHTPELETAILPVGDGVALSVCRQKEGTVRRQAGKQQQRGHRI